MTDPIADMLTRIRNAILVSKPEVVLPFSKVKESIAHILKDHGYIENFEIIEIIRKGKNFHFDQIKVVLKYSKPGTPAILHLKRISKPGRRVYVRRHELPRVLNNLGIAIISTPQGLMTNGEAKKRKLGGEYICDIY